MPISPRVRSEDYIILRHLPLEQELLSARERQQAVLISKGLESPNLASGGRAVRGDIKLIKHKMKSHRSDAMCRGKVLRPPLVLYRGVVPSYDR